jgi:hypothetical protein
MRRSLVGALLGASLVIALTAGRGSSEPAYGPATTLPANPGGGELITHVTAADGQPQVVTIIDPRQRVMAVYHVDCTSGEITPMSVRNFTWDLQMIEHNSGNPLPQDVRSALKH